LREFCSKRQFDNRVLVSEEKLVLWLQDIGLQLHMLSKEGRYDPCSATEEEEG
jgi:hypothetical protein